VTPETWANGIPAITTSDTRTLQRMRPCRTVQAPHVLINQADQFRSGENDRHRLQLLDQDEQHDRDGQTAYAFAYEADVVAGDS
jgi:hypothetical protein